MPADTAPASLSIVQLYRQNTGHDNTQAYQTLTANLLQKLNSLSPDASAERIALMKAMEAAFTRFSQLVNQLDLSRTAFGQLGSKEDNLALEARVNKQLDRTASFLQTEFANIRTLKKSAQQKRTIHTAAGFLIGVVPGVATWFFTKGKMSHQKSEWLSAGVMGTGGAAGAFLARKLQNAKAETEGFKAGYSFVSGMELLTNELQGILNEYSIRIQQKQQEQISMLTAQTLGKPSTVLTDVTATPLRPVVAAGIS